MTLPAGTICLYRHHTLLGWLAQTGTHAPVDHAAIVGPTGDRVIAAEHGGVRVEALPALPNADVWLLPPLDPMRGRLAAEAAVGQVGSGYDYAAYVPLVARLVHLPLPDMLKPHLFICSALAVWSWRQAGMDPAPGLPTRTVTPADLFLALAGRGEQAVVA